MTYEQDVNLIKGFDKSDCADVFYVGNRDVTFLAESLQVQIDDAITAFDDHLAAAKSAVTSILAEQAERDKLKKNDDAEE